VPETVPEEEAQAVHEPEPDVKISFPEVKFPTPEIKVIQPDEQKVCFLNLIISYLYHSRLIPEGVAEASHIFSRDAHGLPKLLSCCRRERW
jgi:hypothetical protein